MTVASHEQASILRLSIEHRHRVDKRLRADLLTQREEHEALVKMCDEQQTRTAREAEALRVYAQRARAMTGGVSSQAFSPDELTAYRTYLDVLAERLAQLEADLQQLEAARAAAASVVAGTRRAIARNQGRIDYCDEQASKIERAVAARAEDAVDEESEEAVVALSLAKKKRTTAP